MNKSLTQFEIFDIAKKECNVFTYPEIEDLTSYKQLFNKNSPIRKCPGKYPFCNTSCLILYMNTPNTGHWTLINKINDNLNFLDSYGTILDGQLKFVNGDIPGQDKKYLLSLIKNNKVLVMI